MTLLPRPTPEDMMIVETRNVLADEQRVDGDLQESLPAPSYLSDEIFVREQERIFFTGWFCTGREQQVPNAGDYLVADVAGESVIIVRGRNGRLHAHYNVCRHRGCQLAMHMDLPRAEGRDSGALGEVGHFGRAIRCPYHSWVYDYDGSLRGAPFLRENERFRKEEFSLYPVAIDVWGGFLFVNLTPQTARPLEEGLRYAEHVFGRFAMEDLRAAHRITYEVEANWKVIMENYNECYHCAGVHPELCTVVPRFKQGGGADLDYASGIRQREGTHTYTFEGTSDRAPMPGIADSEIGLHWGGLTYPNMMTSVSSDHVAAFTLWPRGPGQTTITCDFLFHPSEMARGEFDPSDVIEFWDLVNKQDWVICESVQRGMSSRAYAVGYYAPMEDPSLDIRRYVADRLGD